MLPGDSKRRSVDDVVLNTNTTLNRFTLPIGGVPDVTATEIDFPSHGADAISTNSREDNVPKKRMKTLVGHFERSFLKLSSGSSVARRPTSISWENEVRDLTSPLAVERSSLKKKRPRPWSLPIGLELECHSIDTSTSRRKNQRRRRNSQSASSRLQKRQNQKPNFEEHPSLHILPPFRTDGEEEEEEEEARKEEEKEKEKKAQQLKETVVPTYSALDGAAVNKIDKIERSANSYSKKLKDSHNFISSFDDDVSNLVTPFICKTDGDGDDDDDDDDDIDEIEESKKALAVRVNLEGDYDVT